MCASELTTVATILVADDDADLLALTTRRLTKAGYNVITASDGQEALELADRHLPEMAVLDVTMPKLTGPEVLERLRAGEMTRDMLVILISAHFRGPTDQAGRPVGADDFVRKPFGPGELRNRVEALFGR